MGVPPTFDLEGTGTLSQYGRLGSAKQWSPTLLFKYFFNAPEAKVGTGVTHGSATRRSHQRRLCKRHAT